MTVSVVVSQQPADLYVTVDGGQEQRVPAGTSKAFPFDRGMTISTQSAVLPAGASDPVAGTGAFGSSEPDGAKPGAPGGD